MDINKIINFLKSKIFITGIAVLFGLALLVGVFSVGVFVGFHKAKFSYAWGENYHRNFGGPRGGFFKQLKGDFTGRDFIDAHGTFGQVIKIDSTSLVVKGRDNVEKIVLIKNDTEIRGSKDNLQISDLKVDDYVTVIGSPNDQGQIEAKFIRFLSSSDWPKK